MIPPVDVRQIRPCKDCLFFNNSIPKNICLLNIDTIDKRRKLKITKENELKAKNCYNLKNSMEINDSVCKELPCNYHIKSEEYKELIDSRVV